MGNDGSCMTYEQACLTVIFSGKTQEAPDYSILFEVILENIIADAKLKNNRSLTPQFPHMGWKKIKKVLVSKSQNGLFIIVSYNTTDTKLHLYPLSANSRPLLPGYNIEKDLGDGLF
jgi:hypothetical protein